MALLQKEWNAYITEQSGARLMWLTHLLQCEVIYDMQTLTEPTDELNHIIRALSQEEEFDQWEEFSPHPPVPPLRTVTQDQER